jgi:hypothetical protein
MAESEPAFVHSVRFDGMSHVPGAVRDARGWGTQESLLAEVRKSHSPGFARQVRSKVAR